MKKKVIGMPSPEEILRRKQAREEALKGRREAAELAVAKARCAALGQQLARVTRQTIKGLEARGLPNGRLIVALDAPKSSLRGKKRVTRTSVNRLGRRTNRYGIEIIGWKIGESDAWYETSDHGNPGIGHHTVHYFLARDGQIYTSSYSEDSDAIFYNPTLQTEDSLSTVIEMLRVFGR